MDVLSQAHSLQLAALECIRLWNSAFDSSDETATVIFKKVEIYKQNLTTQSHTLWPYKKTYDKIEKAEILIGILLSSAMIHIPDLQKLLNNVTELIPHLSDSPLKARLLIALYYITNEEDDKTEAINIINQWPKDKLTKEQELVKELFNELTSWIEVEFSND